MSGDAKRGSGRLAIPRPTGRGGVLSYLNDGYQWLRGRSGHVLTIDANGEPRFSPAGTGSYEPAGAVATHEAAADPHPQYQIGLVSVAPPSLSSVDVGTPAVSAITTPRPGYRFGASADGVYALGLGSIGANVSLRGRFRALCDRNGYVGGGLAMQMADGNTWYARFRVDPFYQATALTLEKFSSVGVSVVGASERAYFQVWELPHYLRLDHASGGGGSLELYWSVDGINWSQQPAIQTTSVGTPAEGGIGCVIATGGSREYRWICDDYEAV